MAFWRPEKTWYEAIIINSRKRKNTATVGYVLGWHVEDIPITFLQCLIL